MTRKGNCGIAATHADQFCWESSKDSSWLENWKWNFIPFNRVSLSIPNAFSPPIPCPSLHFIGIFSILCTLCIWKVLFVLDLATKGTEAFWSMFEWKNYSFYAWNFPFSSVFVCFMKYEGAFMAKSATVTGLDWVEKHHYFHSNHILCCRWDGCLEARGDCSIGIICRPCCNPSSRGPHSSKTWLVILFWPFLYMRFWLKKFRLLRADPTEQTLNPASPNVGEKKRSIRLNWWSTNQWDCSKGLQGMPCYNWRYDTFQNGIYSNLDI